MFAIRPEGGELSIAFGLRLAAFGGLSRAMSARLERAALAIQSLDGSEKDRESGRAGMKVKDRRSLEEDPASASSPRRS
jgi:hypothetical protein